MAGLPGLMGHISRPREGRRPLHLACCPCWRAPVLEQAPPRRRWWQR